MYSLVPNRAQSPLSLSCRQHLVTDASDTAMLNFCHDKILSMYCSDARMFEAVAFIIVHILFLISAPIVRHELAPE